MLNFKIQRQHFLKPLRAVAGVVERHRSVSSNPIAGQVLIRIENQNQLEGHLSHLKQTQALPQTLPPKTDLVHLGSQGRTLHVG